jgi:hypothetical protein
MVNRGSFPRGCVIEADRGLLSDTSHRLQRRGMSSLSTILKAVHSASVVLRVICDCNLLPNELGNHTIEWQIQSARVHSPVNGNTPYAMYQQSLHLCTCPMFPCCQADI